MRFLFFDSLCKNDEKLVIFAYGADFQKAFALRMLTAASA